MVLPIDSLVSEHKPELNLTKDLYVVKAGNNRIAAAIELGYTNIDCLVYDVFVPGGWGDMVDGMRKCQGVATHGKEEASLDRD